MAAANEEPAKATGPKAFQAKLWNFCDSVGGTYAGAEAKTAGAATVAAAGRDRTDGAAAMANMLEDSAGVGASSGEDDCAQTSPDERRIVATNKKKLRERVISHSVLYLKPHHRSVDAADNITIRKLHTRKFLDF